MADRQTNLRQLYQVSGTILEVTGSHPPVQNAIHARLKWAETASDQTPDARIRYMLTDELPQWDGAASGYRSVLDHPQAKFWYDLKQDRLLASFGAEGAAEINCASLSAELYMRSNGGREAWMGSHPLFTPALTELLKRRGIFSIHAAGAALQGRAILLSGASGAGKSTLSIALARRGFAFLGDDRLFLEMHLGTPRILPFPDDIDLRDGTPELFDELRPILGTPKPAGWPKWKLSAKSFYQASVPVSCEPGLLVFPSISGFGESKFHELSPSEALAELVPNVDLTKIEPTQAHLDILSKLAFSSRCFRLQTGRDFDQVADRLRELVFQLPLGETA